MFVCIIRVLSEELLSIFKQCPSLIIEERLEILDYVSALRHITGNEDFFLHVVSGIELLQSSQIWVSLNSCVFQGLKSAKGYSLLSLKI